MTCEYLIARGDTALRSIPMALRLGLVLLIVIVAMMVVTAGSAEAAINGANHFDDVYSLVKSWTVGSLGKTIAISFLVIGLVYGVLRGSIVACVTALAAAIALIAGPTIIEAIFGSTTT